MDVQPVAEFLKVNLAMPWLKPTTLPLAEMLAIVGLRLVQVPANGAVRFNVLPTQSVGCGKVTTGLSSTLRVILSADVQPVLVFVNFK